MEVKHNGYADLLKSLGVDLEVGEIDSEDGDICRDSVKLTISQNGRITYFDHIELERYHKRFSASLISDFGG